MFYIGYKTTNKINGKIYIGIHVTDNIHDGYMGSGTYLFRAIKKYGIENFEKEILKTFESREEMLVWETETVNSDFVDRDDTYNISNGGYGGWDRARVIAEQKGYMTKEFLGSIRQPLDVLQNNMEKGRETQKKLGLGLCDPANRDKFDWTDITNFWRSKLRELFDHDTQEARRKMIDSSVYKICQDMESRLGIKQGYMKAE